MYFVVNDDFAKTCKMIEIRIVWLDKGLGEWSVTYNSTKAPNATLFSVKNTNSGKWLEKTVLVKDAAFANKGERKSDIAIVAKSKETTVFHLIEVNIK